MNRRQVIAASTLAAAPTLATAQSAMTPPGLTYAFSASITLGPVIDLGLVGGVRKRTVPITGGHFAGPKIRGVIVDGGADWQSILPDGTARIHALYTLKADDGTLIGIDNPGIRRGPPEVLQRLAAGEDVNPALYYFRTTPVFDVADGPHAWLKQSLFIGVGARHPASVDIDYFQVG
jgi:hypothetical protein